MRVVRELTASRSKLVAGKSIMAERFAELQVGSLSEALLSVTASLQTSPRMHACASESSQMLPGMRLCRHLSKRAIAGGCNSGRSLTTSGCCSIC